MPFITTGYNGPHFSREPAKRPVFLKNVFLIKQKSYFPPTKPLKLRLAGIPFRQHLREKIADSSLMRVKFFLGKQVPFILIFKQYGDSETTRHLPRLRDQIPRPGNRPS
jgi:hypothetical protein